MIIATARLFIRAWCNKDAEQFYLLSQDAGFNLHPITCYTQKSIETAEIWLAAEMNSLENSGTGMMAVCEIATGELIGIAGLRVIGAEHRFEVTYRFHESAWGRGYATEAARAVLEYGFETLGLSEIAASITPENKDSKKVAEKLGMKYSGNEVILGVNAEIFRVKRADFLNQPSNF